MIKEAKNTNYFKTHVRQICATKYTVINEGRDRLNFPIAAILHSKLLDIINNINVRFIDGPN